MLHNKVYCYTQESEMSGLNNSSFLSAPVVDDTHPSGIQDTTTWQEKDDLTPFGYAVAAIFLFFIMLFGIFNNLVVIVVVGGTKKLRTPMNAILLNLSASDFTISVIGTPLSFASAVNHGWPFGSFMCQAYAFLMTLTGMTGIGTLAAIAIDRYIIISGSFYGQNLSGVSSTVTIILIWIYSLVQSLPPLLGWNRYIVEHPGIACSLDWQTPDSFHMSFIIYIFILGYVLPVAIMSFCYFKVVYMVRNSSKLTGRSSTAKAEQKVTRMAVMMIICTLTAWTPYSVVSLMVSFGYGHLLGPVSSVAPAIFAKTCVVYNPIVYFFLNTQIREVILSKLPRSWKRRPEESVAFSMETKRGLTTIVNTANLGNGRGSATTLNL